MMILQLKRKEAKMKNNFLTLFSLMLLSSCTVGPDYRHTDLYSNEALSKSTGLSVESSKNIDVNWYRQFNDETLNLLLEKGVPQNLDIKISLQKLKQARENMRINNVQYFPTLDAKGSYNYNKPSKNVGFTIGTDYYQTGLDASWELDIWGAGRRLDESSAAVYKAAADNVYNVWLTMTAEVANNYISLRVTQEQLRISERNLRLQENIYKIVKDKYKVGLADDIALNQAQYAVENTKALIPTLQYNAEVYQNSLAIMVGELPGKINDILIPNKKNLVRGRFEYDLNKLYELPVDVVRNRPDVRILEQQMISQNALVGKAIADLYPNISLGGFMGFESTKTEGLVGSDSFMYNYAPTISLPILHWNALTNNVRLQKDIREESLLAYRNGVLNATGEIKNSLVGIEKEYTKNSAYENSYINMREVTKLTLDKYKEGLIEFSDLLTAEQNLLNAQNTLINSNGTIYQNIISFYKATGGGY